LEDKVFQEINSFNNFDFYFDLLTFVQKHGSDIKDNFFE